MRGEAIRSVNHSSVKECVVGGKRHTSLEIQTFLKQKHCKVRELVKYERFDNQIIDKVGKPTKFTHFHSKINQKLGNH